jgi:hypothetical protein
MTQPDHLKKISQTGMDLRPKRSWLQFSLRTIFIVMTLAAAGLAWVASERAQSRRERAIAQQLTDGGAEVDFIGLFDDPNLWWGPQPWWCNQLGDLLGRRVVLVRQSPSSPTDLTPLAECQNLSWLELNDTQVSDLRPLAGLRKLGVLYVSRSPVRDVAPLAELKSLWELRLDGTQVTDLTPLAGLENLAELSLQNTPVTDLTPLYGLKKLRWLDLAATSVSEEQVSAIREALPGCQIRR